MIPLLLLSLLVAGAIGTLLYVVLIPSREQGRAAWGLRLGAGIALGLGVTSILYFAGLSVFDALRPWAADLAALLGLAALVFYRFTKGGGGLPADGGGGDRSGWRWVLPAAFCGALAASLASFLLAVLREPHGKWDAWWIWNFHARFIFRSGEHWRNMFTEALDWTHLDYPLLVPLSVVRAWRYAGGEGLQAPILLAFLTTFLTLGLLWAGLHVLRGRSQGCLGGLVLAGSPFFIVLGASQFADIPLSLYFLMAFLFMFLHDRSGERGAGYLVLAGLAAGLSAWTKNEGLLFVLLLVATRLPFVTLAVGWRGALRQALWISAGAGPVLIAVALFKMQFAPPNDLFAGLSTDQILSRLSDARRYADILKAYALTGLSFTQGFAHIRRGIDLNPGLVSLILLAAYGLLMGVRIDGRDRTGLFQGGAVLLGMLGGSFVIYLVSPFELNYHLMTSLNRLYMQLWPSALLLFFLAVRTPEQALDVGGGIGRAEPKSKDKSRKRGMRS